VKQTVLRIRIRTDPHHLARSGILEADPDPGPRLQNWPLINLFSVEKYCEQNLNTYMLTILNCLDPQPWKQISLLIIYRRKSNICMAPTSTLLKSQRRLVQPKDSERRSLKLKSSVMTFCMESSYNIIAYGLIKYVYCN
jgi:hypothetical protein